MTELHWHTSDETPDTDEPVTALFAGIGLEDREPFLRGIYIWRGTRWQNEDSGTYIPIGGAYVWLLESELVSTAAGALGR